ncbi:putative enzyme related to lactoylglutathione lyase [Nocardiopsis mwathae]|uniref:Putative enzyme related to lactoylglutathione lyase n=1 Tax=Nocardiopsis mwathae TaxID=1472723 RepID=A0A7W9YM80_9ACTN|nr:VOC family protein [Nocardiopsis mwathae]MBB6174569.1 putative enzyme related to lactoylglutathione lyase [Nocardiopsis mwathae]
MALGTTEQIVINAADPARLARFWAVVLGGEVVDRPDGWSYIDGGWEPGPRPRLSFQPAPAAAAEPSRFHLDVRVDDIAAATAEAVTSGARAAGPVVTDAQGSFQVLHDPEGNAFCLVMPAND